MQLLNLSIDRIIIHQIYQKDDEGNEVKPTQSHEFTRFEQSALEAFKARVTDALGEGSNAVQMEIVNQEPEDLVSLVNHMTSQDDESFSVSSYDIAKKLTKAQQTRSIPGGIVVVFSGTQGPHRKKFLGIIKAEIHSAYEKQTNPKTNEISLKFVEEVLLTPGTRLYKTAGFFEKASTVESSTCLNDKWVVMISDSQISKTDGKAAARYFYSSFLGCGYPQTSARTTKEFYDSSSSFIRALDVPETKKNDLLNALTTYLKVDTSSTISSSDFASKYFDTDIQDEFTNHMEDSGLPTTAFTKDIEHIESKLKVRKIRFSKKVNITAPSDAFKELITFESIEGDPDESGVPSEWTKVIIKDRVTQLE